MSNSTIISGGKVNIGPDALDEDIRTLLASKNITPEGLAKWCYQIKAVQEELQKLQAQFDFMMPHQTDGKCLGLDVIKKSSLLNFAFQIQSTQIGFSTSIGVIADRSSRILKKIEDEKQQGSQLSLLGGNAPKVQTGLLDVA